MSDRPPRTSISRIYQLDRVLARDPDDIAARFERAGLHREQGAYEAAKQRLSRAPAPPADRFRRAQRLRHAWCSRPATRRPRARCSARRCGIIPTSRWAASISAISCVALDEFEEARAHFEAALRADPDHIHAHRGMGNVLAEIGDAARRAGASRQGVYGHFLTPLPLSRRWAPIRVLLLVSADGGNTPTASLLDDRLFQTTVLVTEYYDAKVPLPAARRGLQRHRRRRYLRRRAGGGAPVSRAAPAGR